MRKRDWLLGLGTALAVAGACQASYIVGFDEGSDTTMCVVQHFQSGAPPEQIEACNRVNADSTRMKLLRQWREMTGDYPWEVSAEETPSPNTDSQTGWDT